MSEMNIHDIPEDAFNIPDRYVPAIDNIENWWCADCKAKGQSDDIDYVQGNKMPDGEYLRLYCCPECFETRSIYITITADNETIKN